MSAAGIAWVKYTTVVLFASFILMTLILYLALKDDNDAPINPRQPEEQNKRQEK